MTPHHVMTRLAAYFEVVWLDPAHHWRETATLPDRRVAMNRLKPRLPPGFDVYVPEARLFDIYRPGWLQQHQLNTRIQRAWKRLQARGCRTSVLYLWHYQFEAALTAARFDRTLYHIDDEYSFTRHPPPMPDAERRVIQAVDQVLAISPRLLERKGGINARMAFAPEGVDYSLYATPVPAPADIASIPHPRVGYTGTIKVHLDWRLLLTLAGRHPAWSFVFVGPEYLDPETSPIVEELRGRPNVYFLGSKSVLEVAAYPQHFDVCIMPYHVDDYTHNIYPLKLHEYLASGKPVVGSPIRSLVDFSAVIRLAGSLEEWSEQLAASLAEAALLPGAGMARQALARQYDWSERIFDIAGLICQQLGSGYSGRLKKLAVNTPI